MHSKKRNGFTIVELIAAMGLFALVIAMGSAFYINSQRQFNQRLLESEGLHQLFVLDRWLERQLQKKVSICENGALSLENDGVLFSLNDSASRIYSGLELSFSCFEKDPLEGDLVNWHLSYSPALIEYEGWIEGGNKKIRVMGSVLR